MCAANTHMRWPERARSGYRSMQSLLKCSAALLLFPAALCLPAQVANTIALRTDSIRFSADPRGMRYSFHVDGRQPFAADAQAGLLLNGSPVSIDEHGRICGAPACTLHGTSASGERVVLTVTITPHHATLTATPEHPGAEVRFVTGGAAPGYGLADHAVEQQFSTLPDKRFSTDVTGFRDDAFLSGQGQTRLVSNFVIYPRQRFAELLIDSGTKIVATSAQQIVQGVAAGANIGDTAHTSVTLHYFFGNPHEIYRAYLDVRNAAGYRVQMPKYEAFGVGWEAFGALGWETNQKTDTESIDRYLRLGYPLRWVVIGSGFWPDKPDTMHETTSFGLWDKARYPEPRTMVRHFTEEHLTVMLGLRITFIVDGPYSREGAANGYFLKNPDGTPQQYTGGWPKLPYYLLDAHNPAALDWYIGLCGKWQAYGIRGWKEDFYGYGKYRLRDDKVDPTNDRLFAQRHLIIQRNGYLSSNGDLHRINDFNWNQNQDRGPVNALAFAYSGFPFVYPDIVGGTFGENHFSTTRTPRMQVYMQRNAQWAALHSSMGMGEPPWTFDETTATIMLRAAQLHDRIAPYLFANARRSVADGFPWTMTPLSLAFPDDPAVYGRENATDRAYEWLIGDTLLATPLYGEDYDAAGTRDVYLPAGRWMDYDTGKLYAGRQLLRGFALPPGKTPLFVGGSGILLEKEPGALSAPVSAAVYPLGQTNRSATLTLPDAETAFTVTVVHGSNGTWKAARVVNSRGVAVPHTITGSALHFRPEPGERYRITAAR